MPKKENKKRTKKTKAKSKKRTVTNKQKNINIKIDLSRKTTSTGSRTKAPAVSTSGGPVRIVHAGSGPNPHSEHLYHNNYLLHKQQSLNEATNRHIQQMQQHAKAHEHVPIHPPQQKDTDEGYFSSNEFPAYECAICPDHATHKPPMVFNTLRGYEKHMRSRAHQKAQKKSGH